jgi:hypothetical protein
MLFVFSNFEIALSMHCKDTSTISAVNILLGASNGVRLGAFDDNFINASISGATLNNIDQCIDRAISKLENTNSMVNNVVMCLGTNDVSKCKDDSDQVNVLLTQAIAKVKSYFPDSLVCICGIFPRKGTGKNTNILNATTTSVILDCVFSLNKIKQNIM